MQSIVSYEVKQDLTNIEILKLVETYESFIEVFPEKVKSNFFEKKIPLSVNLKTHSLPSKYTNYVGSFKLEIGSKLDTRLEKFIFKHTSSDYIEYNHECSSLEFAIKVFLLLAKSILGDKITVYRNDSNWDEEAFFVYLNLMNTEESISDVIVNIDDEIQISNQKVA